MTSNARALLWNGAMLDAQENPVPISAFLSWRIHGWPAGMLPREMIVEAGQIISVVGVGHWEHDETARPQTSGYHDSDVPKILVPGAPSDDMPLIITDETT